MATFYIDPTRANGTRAEAAAYTPAGLTAGNIYGTAQAAYAAAGGNNHTFLARKGLFHDPVGGVFYASLNTKTGCTFGAYIDTALGDTTALENPIFDGFYYMAPTDANDALWTHNAASPGTWYIEFDGTSGKPTAAATPTSLRTGGVNNGALNRPGNSQRCIGEFQRPANTLANVGASNWPLPCTGETQGIWFCNISSPFRLTVWTGSTTKAPPTFHNGIQLTMSGLSVQRGFISRNGGINNVIQDITLWGVWSASYGHQTMTASAMSGTRIRRTASYAGTGSCYVLTGSGSGPFPISDIIIEDSTVDRMVGKYGIDTASIDFMNDEIVFLEQNVTNVIFRRFNFTTSTNHTAVRISSEAGGSLYNPTAITLLDGTITFVNATDGRGFGISNSKGVWVDNVTVNRAPTKSQITGQNITVSNCTFNNMSFNNDWTNPYWMVEVGNFSGDIQNLNLVFDHNVYDASQSPMCLSPFVFTTFNSSSFGLNTNQCAITNSLFILNNNNQGMFTLAPSGTTAQTNFPIQNQNIKNNYCCRPDGAALNATGFTSPTYAFTVDQPLNGFLGSSGNLTGTYAAAKVDPTYMPNATSPLVAAGLRAVSMTMSDGSAYNLQDRSDARKFAYKNVPSIGKYEPISSRTASIARQTAAARITAAARSTRVIG